MVILQHYIETTYWQPAATHTYDLSIIVGVHSLFYSITNAKGDLCLFKVYQYQTPIHNNEAEIWHALLVQDAFLTQNFASINLAYASPYIVLLPEVLYDSAYVKDYLQTAYANLPIEDLLFFEKGITTEIVAAYALSKTWFSIIQSTHNNITVAKHIAVGWLAFIQERNTCFVKALPTVFVHVIENTLYIAVYKGKDLLYFNSFIFKSADDFLYYILLVYQQLDLNTKENPLYCSGALVADSLIYKLLYQYIQYLDFLPLDKNFAILKIANDLEAIVKTDFILIESATIEEKSNKVDFLPQAYWDLYILSM